MSACSLIENTEVTITLNATERLSVSSVVLEVTGGSQVLIQGSDQAQATSFPVSNGAARLA